MGVERRLPTMPDGTQLGDSARLVEQLTGVTSEPGVERQVSTDQANLSIAVDDRWMVKWLRVPVAPADLETLQRLRRDRFEHMPAVLGIGERDGLVFAIATEFVPGATDGWQWYVDDVLRWIDGALALDVLVATAAEMGRITADLHGALADDPPHLGPLDPVRRRIELVADTAFRATLGDEAARLARRRASIGRALAPLASIDEVAVQRVHGDLHAGQFLRAGEPGSRLLLTDFDGDPTVASADRLDEQPPERDLAALAQSLDHVARVAAKQRPEAEPEAVNAFIEASIEACLAEYRLRHAVDDRLLWPFQVAQELHELAYAAEHLPVWLYVPDAALRRLFP